MSHAKKFMADVETVARTLGHAATDQLARKLRDLLERGGRLFLIGVCGNAEKNVSVNIIRAVDFAVSRGAEVYGIVGRDGGYTKQKGTLVVVSPTVAPDLVTPLAEAFQAVIWHCLVSHPALQVVSTKW